MTNAENIRLVVFDVDGVLTDGGLLLGPHGEDYKRFDSRDGAAIKMMIREGIEVGILTGRESLTVRRRAAELGIKYVRQGAKRKGTEFETLVEEAGVSAEETAYVGDDLVDIPAMVQAGWSAAPANARPEVKAVADYVCLSEGGMGAAAEIVERVLRVQGRWATATARYGGVTSSGL